MRYLPIVVVLAMAAPMVSAPAGVLSASWEAGKIVVANFELTPEAAKPIAALVTECAPLEVRFELELRQNRRYWPDSVVARTLIRNRMQCPADAARVLTRTVDGAVVEKTTTKDSMEALSFLGSTGQLIAFPGLTDSASRLSYSIWLNSTVLSHDREVLSAPRLARTALLPRDK